ncbi:hypothetical protein Vretimale_19154, partial [Volvox reticuliferus]
QIHPVVSRLVSPIEGTDAAHIADCLGLDPARYRGASGGSGGGGGGFDDDDSGLLTGSSTGTLLDQDDNFRSCGPLLLTSPNGSTFPLRGVDEVLRGAVLPDHLLTPPDALGDDSARLGQAALVNQVVIRAREAVSRYYDGALCPDDETVEVAGGCRSAVLRLVGGGGAAEEGLVGPDRIAHPDPARSGVLLRRMMGERDLYLQLCHYHRLLHVDGAVRRHFSRIKAADPKSAVTIEDVRAMVGGVYLCVYGFEEPPIPHTILPRRHPAQTYSIGRTSPSRSFPIPRHLHNPYPDLAYLGHPPSPSPIQPSYPRLLTRAALPHTNL